MKSNITVEFVLHGVPFHATGHYLPGRPAQTYGPADYCYPAEPAEFEFDTLKAEIGSGKWVNAIWALDTPLADALYIAAIDAIENQAADFWDGWTGGDNHE